MRAQQTFAGFQCFSSSLKRAVLDVGSCVTQLEHEVQATPEMLREMEACARELARSVGYVGAATVEFLYGLESKQYYFLELNPRLQVEPPPVSSVHDLASWFGDAAYVPSG